MFDRSVLAVAKAPLHAVGRGLVEIGMTANQITGIGFFIGISAFPLIVFHLYLPALALILLNRIADGLDGTVARLHGATARGAFLDISLDFLFYASIPLAFAVSNPTYNALPAAVLLFCFIGTGCSFLAFAVLAERHGLKSTAYPSKGFYYLDGLTEASETIFVFALMCLMPHWFSWLAYGFSALCAITIMTRLWAGIRTFSAST